MQESLAVRSTLLHDLEEQIFKLKDALEDLRRRKKKLKQDVKDYKNLLHPIRRFPSDLLCEVFQASVEVELWVDCDSCRELSKTLKNRDNIIQVCSRWRTLGISTPKLWSTIVLNLDRNP
ncbi:hypothetical protein C8J56DRAFT_775327, partial [Mycena floridula]